MERRGPDFRTVLRAEDSPKSIRLRVYPPRRLAIDVWTIATDMDEPFLVWFEKYGWFLGNAKIYGDWVFVYEGVRLFSWSTPKSVSMISDPDVYVLRPEEWRTLESTTILAMSNWHMYTQEIKACHGCTEALITVKLKTQTGAVTSLNVSKAKRFGDLVAKYQALSGDQDPKISFWFDGHEIPPTVEIQQLDLEDGDCIHVYSK